MIRFSINYTHSTCDRPLPRVEGMITSPRTPHTAVQSLLSASRSQHSYLLMFLPTRLLILNVDIPRIPVILTGLAHDLTPLPRALFPSVLSILHSSSDRS
jgi:hypothetical protein